MLCATSVFYQAFELVAATYRQKSKLVTSPSRQESRCCPRGDTIAAVPATGAFQPRRGRGLCSGCLECRSRSFSACLFSSSCNCQALFGGTKHRYLQGHALLVGFSVGAQSCH